MAAIITGTNGMLAYHNASPYTFSKRAFDDKGTFQKPADCAFARLSAFAANGNHAPADFDGAVTWDASIDLLFKIAGVR